MDVDLHVHGDGLKLIPEGDSKLCAETAEESSWFQIWMTLGKKE